jgi:hypothetical protein
MKVQNSRDYTFLSCGCGDRVVDATMLADLTSLDVTTATDLNSILDLVRACEVRYRAVSNNSIGFATSVLT